MENEDYYEEKARKRAWIYPVLGVAGVLMILAFAVMVVQAIRQMAW